MAKAQFRFFSQYDNPRDHKEVNVKRLQQQKINSYAVDFYEGKLNKYGKTSVKSLDWGRKKSQQVRFAILTDFYPVSNKAVLDVGCGFADLYGYLKKTTKAKINYCGIELSKKIAAIAQQKYPQARIICDDFLAHGFGRQKFDIVYLSGTLNLVPPYGFEYRRRVIEKMYSLARIGVAFNLTSTYTARRYKTKHSYYAAPDSIFKFCKTICDNVVLKHDYLPNDFTCYLYKNTGRG